MDYQRDIEMRNDKANARVAQLEKQVAGLENEIKLKDAQIKTLQGLGEKRIDELVKVDAIKLSRYTGGVSRNSKPGQDSLKVIFTPVDAAGDAIKAAGDVKISLFDLAAKNGETLVKEFSFTPAEAINNWAGGLMSSHYSFTLPIPESFKGETLTVRVVFTDLLTGKTFDAQTACRITR